MPSCPRCQNALPDPPERFCPTCGADLSLLSPPAPDGERPTPRPGLPPIPPPATDVTPSVPYGAPRGDARGSTAWAPGPGAREGTPWERRHEIGFATALIETTQRVITKPSAFFREMPVTGGIGSPLLYALIIGYAGVVISALYDFVLESVGGSALSRFGGGDSAAVAGLMPYFQGAMGFVMRLIFGPVFLVVGLFLLSGVVHLGLMALGGAARGFEATFRVACYAEAAALLNIVPGCGSLISAFVMIVLMIIGISEAHGTTRGRAAAAVLLPIVLCCCCLMVPLGIGLASLIGAAGMQ